MDMFASQDDDSLNKSIAEEIAEIGDFHPDMAKQPAHDSDDGENNNDEDDVNGVDDDDDDDVKKNNKEENDKNKDDGKKDGEDDNDHFMTPSGKETTTFDFTEGSVRQWMNQLIRLEKQRANEREIERQQRQLEKQEREKERKERES